MSSFGFSLQYYGNDYTQITGNNSFANITSAFGASAKPLYNGNISSMVVNIPKIGDARAYAYTYDQLNRITAMDAWGGLNNNTNQFTPVSLNGAYQERITYDPNGNILTYKRNGEKVGAQQRMDELIYNYKNNNNQLKRVRDAAPAANYSEDIDDQPANNYDYDAIGNLIKDTKEGITKINWTVYGKIESIEKSDGTTISYSYDAAGNRINKTVTKGAATTTTAYVRDAQGNVLSIYTTDAAINSGHFTQSELHLYGSSRLGIYNLNKDLTITPPAATNLGSGNSGAFAIFERGKKFFELSNHLGNVLATVSDEKIGVDADNNGTIDYYTADVVSAQDYYPFGMMMPGRKYAAALYRYGFNGKEMDNEALGIYNWLDYGMRAYDPRTGRFLSVDPLTKKYPHYTPYQFAGNMPIAAIDLDGLEPAKNPADPANQDNRNPTATINTIFEQTGGNENFKKTYDEYMKGKFDPSAKFFNMTNKDGFVSDTKFDISEKYNIWVNNSGVFYADDYRNYDTKDFTNFLLGSLINGVGPENIAFPVNGTISNLLKNSGIVNDAMDSWYALNKMTPGLLFSLSSEFKGDIHSLPSLLNNGFTHPETFLGSASITIRPINSEEVMVSVFNITSLTSGDLSKHFPWNKYPTSVVRDPSLPEGSTKNKYGNISQLYQFTLPIDFSRLTKE